jgi:predicted Fe-Mo cluster-binding NifX family protein
MKICFPVQNDKGMDSTVYNHFGSAPVFVVVDTTSDGVASVINRDQHHAHGACNPLKALDGQQIDAVVVGGIGAGALTRLNQAGISVHRSQAETVRENVALFAEKRLPELSVQGCCGGHSAGGGCAH